MGITQNMIRDQFDRFLKNIGKEKAEKYNDPGKYYLDYNSVYGGWSICRNNKNGGVCPIPNHDRYRNMDFFNILRFFNETLERLRFEDDIKDFIKNHTDHQEVKK